jgi:uncharacterized membrane protein YeaQ/YmgE (transglycosylase-associated protein family)
MVSGLVISGGGFGIIGNIIVGIIGSFRLAWRKTRDFRCRSGEFSVASVVTAVLGAVVTAICCQFNKKGLESNRTNLKSKSIVFLLTFFFMNL